MEITKTHAQLASAVTVNGSEPAEGHSTVRHCGLLAFGFLGRCMTCPVRAATQ